MSAEMTACLVLQLVDCNGAAADAAPLPPAVHAVAAAHAVQAEHAGLAKMRKGMKGAARLGSKGGQLPVRLEAHL